MNDDIRPRQRIPISRAEPEHEHITTRPINPETNVEIEDSSEAISSSPAEFPRSEHEEVVQKPKRNLWHRLRRWHPTKKQRLIIIPVIIIIVIGGGLGVNKLLSNSKPHTITATIKVTPVTKPVVSQPATVPSTLTGLPVSPSVNQLPVTAVMIENSTDARPQSGLAQAGIVFEAVAEGGITRYMALYQDTSPGYVGPIRSVRPYYLQLALGFDASIAHVGGSPEAIQDIQAWNVKDLDQFYNGSYYQRVNTRPAPHNVYTSIALLNQLEDAKSNNTSTYSGFPRKTDSPTTAPTATSIDFNPSISEFEVHYDYNSTNDSYTRSVGGEPDMDVDQAGNETQVAPKVVIALVMQQSLEADGLHTVYGTIGSGQAYIFQDGIVTIATWQKTSNTSQITFSNTKGQTINLNAGQTWVTIVGSSNDVSYKT